MAWTFGLVGSQDPIDDVIGEIHRAYQRRLVIPLNGLPVASCRLELADTLVDEIISRDCDVMLKVYQGSTLRFIGELTQAEEVTRAEEHKPPSFACNFAGPLWVLQKRTGGTNTAEGFTVTGAPTDLAQDVLMGRIEAANAINDTRIREGTLDSLYVMKGGPYRYKPVAEFITETQRAKVPFPVHNPPGVTHLALDDFTFSGSEQNLNGLTDDSGNTWTTSGSTGDFRKVAASVAYRDTGGDASARYAIDGLADRDNVVVGFDLDSGQAGGSGTYPLFTGVIARYKDTSNYLLGGLELSTNTAYLEKRTTADGTTLLGSAVLPAGLLASNNYTFRLLVDDTGHYSFWFFKLADGIGAPIATGRDDELAAGGTLSTANGAGQCGFLDVNSGTAFGRSYDNFVIADFTGPQSFDFQINPVEPVADSPPPIVNGIKIATIDIRTQIGASKPNVIFEYGGGDKSMRQYRRAWDREGLCNVAYSLPVDFPDNTDVRVSENKASQTARGFFEEVVAGDFPDSQLRQAWADANVGARSSARQEITFEPSASAHVFGTDYVVGDIVTGRASMATAAGRSVRFNALFRVYAIELTIDENGKETLQPKLVPE